MNTTMRQHQTKNVIVWFLVLFLIVFVIALSFWLLSQDENDQQPSVIRSVSYQGNAGETDIEFTLTNLNELSVGYYEAWSVANGETISLGTFATDSSGRMLNRRGEPLPFLTSKHQLETIERVFITIEQEESADAEGEAGPSSTVVLHGETDDTGLIHLSFPHADIATQVSGGYILATPTNDPEGLETSGLWFTTPNGQSASLDMPDAPDGWAYAAWVTRGNNTTSLPIGRFSDVSGADDSAAHSSTSNPGFLFPGEDFLNDLPEGFEPDSVIDLADGDAQVYVTLVPGATELTPALFAPEFGLEGLAIPLLHAVVPAGLRDHTLSVLTPIEPSTFPQGIGSMR
jgi:hypothetical protein